MIRLSLLVDEKSAPLTKAAAVLAVPLVLVLALPLLLLVVLLLYLAAVLQGARVLVHVVTGKPSASQTDLPKPHFLEHQVLDRALPDDSKAGGER